MFKKLWGRVPDKWLFNYAHVVIAQRFAKDNLTAIRIAFPVCSIFSSLKWNRSVSIDMLKILFSRVFTELAKMMRYG
jgi:hypothetical protein